MALLERAGFPTGHQISDGMRCSAHRALTLIAYDGSPPRRHRRPALRLGCLVVLGQVGAGVGMSRWQVGQAPAQVARSVCISRMTV
ncbi:hypothetical protein GZL_04429 [Streptomyces sp. 769]|nr:hypothetical protein GZL_04429 [Streptomyces sp. 769]